MPQQLTNIDITRVSLVDKGANQRRLAVLKRNGEGSMAELAAAPADTTPTGIAAWLQKAADALLGRKVAKTSTFAEIIRGQELNDALYDSWTTLQDALWGAIYAYDDEGKPLEMSAKEQLVAQNLDEFKAYLLGVMSSVVEKSAGDPTEVASRHVAAVVAKVGRKISGSRLERLTAAAEALTGVLAEVAEEKDDSASAQEEEIVEKNELVAAVTEAVTKAQEPLIERIEKLEQAKPAAAPAAGSGSDEGDAPATLDDVVEVVGKLADRLEQIEKGAGGRSSIVGQDGEGGVKKSQSVFAGWF